MTEIAMLILAVLTPFLTISAFVIGYNVNADRKLFKRKTKTEKTEREALLEKIDNAKVY